MKRKKLVVGTLAATIVISFTITSGIQSKDELRTKTEVRGEIESRTSEYKITHSAIKPLEYQTSSNSKYQLQAVVDVVEGEEASGEPSLEGPVSGTLPKVFSLKQNYPNPFNPSTTIQYEIPEQGEEVDKVSVQINIYSLRGRLLQTLVNEEKEPGIYKVQWDGRNERGERVSSGVYLYRITAGDYVSTRKMAVLK